MANYIDAIVVKGEGNKPFTVSIEQRDVTETSFEGYDLSNYSVRFRVLGAPTADAKVLVEHIITQNSDIETVGQITDAANGQFTFVVSEDDQDVLGLGVHPISIDILDAASLTKIFTLTEGGNRGEFNCIQIVEV